MIDSVMDIDYAAGRITYDHADQMIDYITSNGLKLEWIIETHVHADHLSAAPYLQEKLGGKIGIGDKITVVQDTFGKVFNEGTEFQRDGSQFDALFKDGDTYRIGSMHRLRHIHAGPYACLHGPCDRRRGLCGRYAVHAGWWLGAGGFPRWRCCHAVRLDPEGAGPAGRDAPVHVPRLRPEWPRHPVGNHRGRREGSTTSMSVAARRRKSSSSSAQNAMQPLGMPSLILPSLQVNMRAGEVPTDKDGRPMLKVPVNAL